VGCRGPAPTRASDAALASAPTADSRACAWFGDARGDTLYFGISAFWRAMREAGGDPTAELRAGVARQIGRFDLAARQMLAPLAIGPEDARSGVWDVLAHPNGWLYFTTFYEVSGRVEPASGRVEWFAGAGTGLNELALGPEGRVLATRYGRDGANGAVVVLEETGAVVRELPLASEPGVVAAAKSIAWDAARGAVWVNTDLLAAGAPHAHDARVLELASGRELARWSVPELQFMSFAADGTGFLAERSGELLRLRVLPPDARAALPLVGRIVPLDDAMPATDFVQELRVAADGRVVLMRWSGSVHVVSASGEVRDLAFPRAEGGLYYSGVLTDGALCATHCAGVEVSCRALPRRSAARR
jgi:hypothetical protein